MRVLEVLGLIESIEAYLTDLMHIDSEKRKSL